MKRRIDDTRSHGSRTAISHAVSVRRFVLGAIVLVTAWSIAAAAQPLKTHKSGTGTAAGTAHLHHDPLSHQEKGAGGPEGKTAAGTEAKGPGAKTAAGTEAKAPDGAEGKAPDGKNPDGKAAAGAEGKGESKGAGAEGSAEEKPEDAAPAPINLWSFGRETPPFLATLVNFAILAGGFFWLGRKPIATALQNRRDTIAKEIDEAQAMKHEAEERAKTYQAKLERLEQEVRGMREALLHAGEAESERMVREAEAKAERMRKDAEFLVEQELKQIRENLWRETVEAAIANAEGLLKERVTPADQERLAEDFLADLGKHAAPSRDAHEATS